MKKKMPFLFLAFERAIFSIVFTNRSSTIIKNQKRKANIEEAINYFDVMASYLDELRKIQNLVREKIGYKKFKCFFLIICFKSSYINIQKFRNDLVIHYFIVLPLEMMLTVIL